MFSHKAFHCKRNVAYPEGAMPPPAPLALFIPCTTGINREGVRANHFSSGLGTTSRKIDYPGAPKNIFTRQATLAGKHLTQKNWHTKLKQYQCRDTALSRRHLAPASPQPYTGRWQEQSPSPGVCLFYSSSHLIKPGATSTMAFTISSTIPP